MVRVISVHNFPRQNVSSVGDVTHAAVGSLDRLVLAQTNHNVCIKTMNDSESEVNLSTVDQPLCVEFSERGNYIATLEKRGEVKFVRVYLGWESADGSTPLRARIAGIVSPLSQQVIGVEMLEIPTPAMPDLIAVCHSSGNLLVGSQDKLSVFRYKVKQHDISRLEFADLFKVKWTIQLSFTPNHVKFCEDVIAAHSERYLVVLRVTGNTAAVSAESEHTEAKLSFPIDYDKLVEAPHLYDVNFKTHKFPSIAAEPQVATPFIPFTGVKPSLIFDSPSKVENIKLVNLLQIQLSDCVISASGRRDANESFTCLQMIPYYSSKKRQTLKTVSPLGGPQYENLDAIAVFFGTQQEGYLYHIIEKCSFVCVYPFTAPLQNIVLEEALLHALTDAGLETYTMRFPNFSEGPLQSEQSDPNCLLGLRPFVHVQMLLIGSQFLYLLVSQDPGAPWTVYQLSLAEPAALWGDFLAAADENRWDAPSIYSHLLREGNRILNAKRNRLKFLAEKEGKGGNPANHRERWILVDSLYKQSSALLADHYLLLQDEEKALFLYKQSDLKLREVVNRIESLLAIIGLKYDKDGIKKVMLQYVRQTLEDEDERCSSFGDNNEEYYTPEVSSTVAVVLNILEKEDADNVARVILSSPVVQQFGSERSLGILTSLADPQPTDLLALAVLHLQRGQGDRGRSLLASLDHYSIEPLLLENPRLLYEPDNSPSELSLSLLEINPRFLANVMSAEIKMGRLSFEVVQKMLTSLLQSGGMQGKNAADVLEIVIEEQVERLKNLSSQSTRDTVYALACLYINRLSQGREVPNADSLFSSSRPKYLDQLPPFAADFNQILSPQQTPTHLEVEPKNVLIKLQSLLGDEIARESLFRVRVLLSQTPRMFGSFSITVQCAGPPEAAQMLVNFAPQALLAYAKEVELDEHAWRNIIEQVKHKISSATDTKRKLFYEKLLNGVYEHIAKNLASLRVTELIPPELPERGVYLRLAYNNEQARNVRSLIMLTGNQFS